MDRLYKITHYEYAYDVGRNLIELYIVPDEDLLLYLSSIPKLEPQILMTLNGYRTDGTLFQCNYYATVDNISNAYCKDVDYMVFIINSNLVSVHYDYAIFPKSNIKEKFKKEKCDETSLFKGSINPPSMVYNPKEKRFTSISVRKQTVKPRNGNLKKMLNKMNSTSSGEGVGDDDWSKESCSHGLCKAELTTEPPLLKLLDRCD